MVQPWSAPNFASANELLPTDCPAVIMAWVSEGLNSESIDPIMVCSISPVILLISTFYRN